MIFNKSPKHHEIKKFRTGFPVTVSDKTFHPVYKIICEGLEGVVYCHMEPKGFIQVSSETLEFLSLDDDLSMHEMGINLDDLIVPKL